MKKFFWLLVLSISLTGVNLSAQGIEFFKGTWKEALSESSKSGKPIFVDAYTVWCGPCKWMAANVFTNEEVGTYFNQNFINYKYDMEKGEGVNFSRQYQIQYYPTLLFIDKSGNVKHRVVGAKSVEDLLNEGQMAVKSIR